MAFFDNAKKNYQQVSQNALQKTKDISEVVKLNNNISANEDKIRELFHKLGYECYRAYKAGTEAASQQFLDEIDSLYQLINADKERINEINAANKCPSCGAKISKKDIFCVNCGTKLNKTDSAAKPVCKSCGVELLPGAAFCGNCGTKVE